MGCSENLVSFWKIFPVFNFSHMEEIEYISKVQANFMRKIRKINGIIGIDEVGRGSLAGPVAVAAVFLPKNLRFRGLKDSKKLSPKKREEWFKRICARGDIFWSVAMVSPKIIDKINISQAANLAATRALARLIANSKGQRARVYLDGGLYLKRNLLTTHHKLQTLVRGDEKINAIKLASIIAKVSRDRLMVRLHKKYPEYDFQKHKGYGTKRHKARLKKFGPSELHRLKFIRSEI